MRGEINWNIFNENRLKNQQPVMTVTNILGLGYIHRGIITVHEIHDYRGNKIDSWRWYPGEEDALTQHQWWYTKDHLFLLNMDKNIENALVEAYEFKQQEKETAHRLSKKRRNEETNSRTASFVQRQPSQTQMNVS